jgi:hypothetical protein
MRLYQVYTRSQRFGSNINQRAYTGGSKYSKLKWYKMNLFKAGVDVLKLAIDGILYRQAIACLYKCWSEPGHGGLLPVFTNAGQSSDIGAIACLYKCWSELGHGGWLLMDYYTDGTIDPHVRALLTVCKDRQ